MTHKRHDLGQQWDARANQRIAFKHALPGRSADCDRIALTANERRRPMRAMGTSAFGWASRIAISGTSVWPPAMCSVSCAASMAQASSRSAGRAYSNAAAFMQSHALG